MQEGIESGSELIVSGCDAAELLVAIEETLNKLPGFVVMPVDVPLGFSVAAWRDIGLSALSLDGFNQVVAVIASVGRDPIGLDVGNQGRPFGHISHLPAGEDQANWVAQGKDAGVNLGGQSALRPADRLITAVFLGAPAACWWVRTRVVSMKSSSVLLRLAA